MERLWALKSGLTIPRSAILSVDYRAERPAMQDFAGYLRFPGSNLPGRFLAGKFVRAGEREFWYVRMQSSGVLLLELKPGEYPYRRVRLTCDPETAQKIADWWHHGKAEQA